MSDDLDLDPDQERAAQAAEPVIAVLAGPGSGKTKALAARARHLLSANAADNALVLAFMNKAAAEVKSRCLSGAPFQPDRIFAGTFHAFGANVLRSHGALVGVGAEFEILDEVEAATLAALTPSEMWALNRRRVRAAGTGNVEPASYTEAKRAENAVDYADLLILTAQIFRDYSDLARAYGLRFRHLLVDEFQDTDESRFAIIEALASHVATISVFADDDQAIMGFAGAERANVERFCDQLEAVRYELRMNYRSGDVIIAAANRLIAHSTGSCRVMIADRAGGLINVTDHADERAEADFICDAVLGHLATRSPRDIAVLIRNKRRGDEIAEALSRAKVTVSDWRDRLTSPDLTRDLSACFATLRGSLARRHEMRLCELADIEPSQSGTVAGVLDALSDTDMGGALTEMRAVAYATGDLIEMLRLVASAIARSRPGTEAEYVALEQVVAGFVADDPTFGVDHLLVELAIGSPAARPADSGGVKLATLHRTKGLEWPVVFIAGMEQDTLPDFRNQTGDSLDEERRLCFVGVTRARDELHLSRARQVSGWAKSPSRFLREMQD